MQQQEIFFTAVYNCNVKNVVQAITLVDKIISYRNGILDK